jgi:hypothetical protein
MCTDWLEEYKTFYKIFFCQPIAPAKEHAADRATVNAAHEQKRQSQNGTGTTRNVSSVTFEEPSGRSDDATPAAAPAPAPGAGTAFGGRAAVARGN